MDRTAEVIDAIQASDAQRLRELVSEDPALASVRDTNGVSALMLAQYQRRDDLVAVLLNAGVTLDIFEAAALGDDARLTQHLDSDASLLGAWSPDGFTPLHFAAFFGHPRVLGLLIERGADVNAVARNSMAVQPLHSAAASGRVEIVEQLLRAGAEPNGRQHGGWTALHSAVQHDNATMVRLLIEHGADPRLRADDGRSPLEMALERGNTEVLGLLPEESD